MMPEAHEDYAKDLLLSLSADIPETETLPFVPNRAQSRNAASAMTAIIRHRVAKNSGLQPTLKENKTYEWKNGIFNCRNIANRANFWTNIRSDFAKKMHAAAEIKPVAYLFGCSAPLENNLLAWALPEPLLHGSLSSLEVKQSGEEYTIQIRADKQRIEHYALSPHLTQYFRRFPLSPLELQLLDESRRIDAEVKLERKIAHENKGAGEGDDAGDLTNVDFDMDESYPEGRELSRLHQQKERNQKAVKRKKRIVLASTGKLICEVCDFDFESTYGDLGHGFAECHHRVPLARPKDEHRIRLREFAIVCTNCHRMLHRCPLHTVEELRKIFMGRRGLNRNWRKAIMKISLRLDKER